MSSRKQLGELARPAGLILFTKVAVAHSGKLPSKEWLEFRLALMSSYTARAVETQSNPNFRWALLVDSGMLGVKDEILRAARGLGEIVEVDSDDLASSVQNFCADNDLLEWATGRLDSDDIISSDYVEKVLSNITPGGAVSFPRGARLDLRTGRIRLFCERSSPFAAYYDSRKNIWHLGNHKQILKRAPTTVVDSGKPEWGQIVSGVNLENRIRWYHLPTNFDRFFDQFPGLEKSVFDAGEKRSGDNFVQLFVGALHDWAHLTFARWSSDRYVRL